MSQSRVNLATAKRELAERQDEANLCMVELKHAQEVLASGGSGAKVLSVTVQEIFGDITVDRVAVRPDTTPAQEKVVVEGIPCDFTLESTVESFDLVLMAENATNALKASAAPAAGRDSQDTDGVILSAEDAAEAVRDEAEAAAAAAAAAVADKVEGGDDESEEVAESGAADSVRTSEQAAAVQNDEADRSTEADADKDATTGAAETLDAGEAEEAVASGAGQIEGEQPPSVPAVLPAEEKSVVEEAAPMSGSTGKDSSSDSAAAQAGVGEGVEEAEATVVEAPAAQEGESASASVEEPAADAAADEESAAAALSLDTAAAEAEATAAAAKVAEEGLGVNEAVVAADDSAAEGVVDDETTSATDAAAAALAATNGDVSAASPATAAALGCSTGTTEVVVPSSELNFKLSQGQWRYLEAESTPVHGDGAVEVTKGIRFSTSLKALDSGEDEKRILELSQKFDEAERRVQSAEAMIKKLQPSPAGASGRKKVRGVGSGGQKSAPKKAKGSKAGKADAAKKKGGAARALSATVGNAFATVKTAGALAWGARNLVFFAAAVAAMHLHGDYLAV